MKFIIILAVLALTLKSIQAINNNYLSHLNSVNMFNKSKEKKVIQYLYYPSKNDENIRGSIIIFHGLNQRPSTFEQLALELSKDGFDIYILYLSGHKRGDLWEEVTEKDWLEEWRLFYAFIKNKNRGEKLVSIGFSLGAVLTYFEQCRNGMQQFDKSIYLSTPFSYKWYVSLIHIFNLFSENIKIPSKNSSNYRVHKYTPIFIYNLLFNLNEKLNQLKCFSKNKEDLFIYNVDDQLIDIKSSVKMVKENHRSKIFLLENDKTNELPPHLIIDKNSLGEENWNKILDKIRIYINHQESK